MVRKYRKKVTIVHEYPRHVQVSEKNPTGITIVDEHPRHFKGPFVSSDELSEIFKKHPRDNLIYPAAKKLRTYKDADKYDELIAVWTDYFNKKFNADPKLDPDVVKALIASESKFDPNARNDKAIGIVQITITTLAILQNPKGEAKQYLFKNIRQKDLKDPAIEIPLAVRWLFRKRVTAAYTLKHFPNNEELILD